ncbi:MAG: glycerophosphodiester phosphodiesterase [Tabrizicola sp.]|nr:glycerophosphodiester phosphodiesterase [Tabrizicola sp.]
MALGLQIERNGRAVRLKWHRARRFATDTAFTGARLVEGLQAGASVEIDINRHGSGGFAVLHDPRLDRETTGSGAVAEADPVALRDLFLRDNAGHPTAEPLMLLEDIADLLANCEAAPGALLQLDIKTEADDLTEADLASFRKAVGRMGVEVILSSDDAVAVRMLAGAALGVLIGHDPCHGRLVDALGRDHDFGAFVREALAENPDATMIYLAIPIVLAADDNGYNMVAAFQDAGRRVDAWTMQEPDAAVLRRLLDLGVDQITTDDPVAVERAAARL